ncbi:MAG: hypothetical protein JXR23_04920 [Pontiellaceae bacterium]|nr:hypothetical protein [Pontiellaceae bacterium]
MNGLQPGNVDGGIDGGCFETIFSAQPDEEVFDGSKPGALGSGFTF